MYISIDFLFTFVFMVMSNLQVNDPYNLYPTQVVLKKQEQQIKHLRKILLTWHNKLSGIELYEMSVIIGLSMKTICKYLRFKESKFKVHLALAILCYLEVNYSHLKD